MLDSRDEINVIYSIFFKDRDFSIRLTNIEAEKVDSFILNIYGIVVVDFLMLNKANQIRFLEEIIQVVNINPEIVFRMFFLTFNNTDINFLNWKLR